MSDVRLFGISGVYEVRAEGLFCFGGYFKHSSRTGQILEGQLVDCYGTSKIQGKMNQEEGCLEFTKSYHNRDFSYIFHQRSSGIWAGEWRRHLASHSADGGAVCFIHDCEIDADELTGTVTQGVPLAGDDPLIFFAQRLANIEDRR